jgi:hypothetical protein
MNLCESHLDRAAASNRRVCNNSSFQPSSIRSCRGYADGTLWKWRRFARNARVSLGFLGVLWLGLAGSAWAQSSATVTWNPSASVGVTGYKVYWGSSSRAYSQSLTTGNTTSATLGGLAPGSTIYIAATTLVGGREGPYSTEVVYTVPSGRPVNNLTFPAVSGTITLPFVVLGGILYQPMETTLAVSGRAEYDFTITTPGNYVVTSMVYAPDGGANSAYVNIDAEPTDPLMVWDVPIGTNFVQQTVTWRDGLGNHIFNLGVGNHQLIVRGREADTQFASFTISPADAILQMGMAPGGRALLSGMGKIGHTYTVLGSPDLAKWTSVGTVTVDNTGSFQFIDSTSVGVRYRFYRLME